MTLAASYEPTKDLANAVTTIFTATWNPLNTDYVKVYSENYTTGVQTEITSGFTPEILSNDTLKITFDSAPGDATPADSVYIILSRSTTVSQEQPFTTSSGFQAKVAEGVWDKAVAMLQEVIEGFARALSYPLGTSSAVSSEIPVPEAGKPLVGASDGLSFENGDTDITALDTAVSATEASASAASSSASAASTDASDASDSADAAASSAASITVATITAANNPIGTVRVFGVSTNPATLLGFTSTWTAITGRVIVGIAGSGTFDTLDEELGAETVNSSDHAHSIPAATAVWGTGGTTNSTLAVRGTDSGPGASATPDSESTGGEELSILQPSITKYCWQRAS